MKIKSIKTLIILFIFLILNILNFNLTGGNTFNLTKSLDFNISNAFANPEGSSNDDQGSVSTLATDPYGIKDCSVTYKKLKISYQTEYKIDFSCSTGTSCSCNIGTLTMSRPCQYGSEFSVSGLPLEVNNVCE